MLVGICIQYCSKHAQNLAGQTLQTSCVGDFYTENAMGYKSHHAIPEGN